MTPTKSPFTGIKLQDCHLRVVSHKSCWSGSNGSIVQDKWSPHLDLVSDSREFPGHLHGCFDRVNGHEENTKEGSSSTGGHGFQSYIQIFGGFEAVQGSQDAGIGSSISESTEWSLQQGWYDTLRHIHRMTPSVSFYHFSFVADCCSSDWTPLTL